MKTSGRSDYVKRKEDVRDRPDICRIEIYAL